MKSQRFVQVSLILSAIAIFATTSFFTIEPEQKMEAVLVAVFFLPIVFLGYFMSPNLQFSRRKHFLVDVSIVAIMVTKHYTSPVDSEIHAIISFSFVFYLGKAFSLIAILELFQKRINHNVTYLILYSFLVITAASYTTATQYFLPLLALYSGLLITLTRLRLISNKTPKRSFFVARIITIIVIITCSYSVTQTFVHYRKELSRFDPSRLWGDQYHHAGFSPISELGTKNIETSRVPILRYFAPRGLYHLRGKSFDTYNERRWSHPNQVVREIIGYGPVKWKTFDFFASEDGKYKATLLFIKRSGIALFAPLNCVGLQGPARKIKINQEKIIRGPILSAGTKISLKTGTSPTVTLSPDDIKRYTQLPENADYFREYASNITALEDSPAKKVYKIKRYLEDHYPYHKGFHVEKTYEPIQYFLEQRKGGHCEMFASAFVMLVRSQGIPARYVGGYYAHEWNKIGEFLTVRACDAHAWAEVYLPEKGWITIDPTPPESLHNLLYSYRGYGEETREYFSEKMRTFSMNMNKIFQFFGWLGSALSVVLALILIWSAYKYLRKSIFARHREYLDENHKKLRNICKKFHDLLKKKFRTRHSYETYREYYDQARDSLPSSQQQVYAKFLSELEKILYNEEQITSEQINRLQSQWREISR